MITIKFKINGRQTQKTLNSLKEAKQYYSFLSSRQDRTDVSIIFKGKEYEPQEFVKVVDRQKYLERIEAGKEIVAEVSRLNRARGVTDSDAATFIESFKTLARNLNFGNLKGSKDMVDAVVPSQQIPVAFKQAISSFIQEKIDEIESRWDS